MKNYQSMTHSLGSLLEKARNEAGLSQKQLSDKTGIGQPNLSAIENGKGNPGLKTIGKIADALGINILFDYSYEENEEDDAYAV